MIKKMSQDLLMQHGCVIFVVYSLHWFLKEFNHYLKTNYYSFRVRFKPVTFRVERHWKVAYLINSGAITIEYFYLQFIPLSRRHQYSKLRNDNATCSVNLAPELVINKFQESSLIFFKWFKNNYGKVNSDKSYL